MTPTLPPGGTYEMAERYASMVRGLQAQKTAQLTLTAIANLAPLWIPGCDEASISLISGGSVETFGASSPVAVEVDLLQYAAQEGPCLDAIWLDGDHMTDDLATETRWPHFSARVAAETGIRSMLSLRLFSHQETIGSLNLSSTAVAAFGIESRAAGTLFAAYAAVAIASARDRDLVRGLARDLSTSAEKSSSAQALAAVDLQLSLLPSLPELGTFSMASRYVPAVAAAKVGGDWVDVFSLPSGATALVVGDVAGHDFAAAVQMGQLRNVLRAVAVDRPEQPGETLRRLDAVSEHLRIADTATCIYAHLDFPTSSGARMRFANAGHPPPLVIAANGDTRYLQTLDHPLLGLGLDLPRPSTTVHIPGGSTLLFYTDGLVERRGREPRCGPGAAPRTGCPS